MNAVRLIAGPIGALAVMAALLPPGAVVASRLVWPAQGPAIAAASQSPASSIGPLVWSDAGLTDAQLDAQKRAAEALAQPLGPSPFPAPTPATTKGGTPVVAQSPLAKHASEFVVSSILNGQQPVAIVNSKVCRVGGKIVSQRGDTWIVTAIDASAGSIEVENAAIGTLTLRIQPAAGR